MDLKQTIAELEKLDAERTQGEWVCGRMDMESYHTDMTHPFKRVYLPDNGSSAHEDSQWVECLSDRCRHDAAFIVAAPKMMQVIREQQRLLLHAKSLLKAVQRSDNLPQIHTAVARQLTELNQAME